MKITHLLKLITFNLLLLLAVVSTTANASAMSLVKSSDATRTSSQNGNWSDPATWGGSVPVDGDRVWIQMGHSITVDNEVPTKLMTLLIDGALTYADDKNTSLTVDTALVGMMGSLTIGDASNPIQANYTARFIIDNYNNRGMNQTDPQAMDYDPMLLGVGLMSMGKVRIHGAEKTHGGELAIEPSINDSSLTLDFSPVGWKVNDDVVIAGTTQDAQGDEIRQISAINGNVITLSSPLAKNHHSVIHSKVGLDLKIHVINLTRNVSIETEASDQLSTESYTYLNSILGDQEHTLDLFERRGHVMMMSTDVDISYAGFYGLGRTNKNGAIDDPIVDGNNALTYQGRNPRARYPLHFHQVGWQDVVKITGNAVHNSPGWGFVNHSSNIDFHQNVAYNVDGASFVTEAGDELGSFTENISIRNTGDESNTSTRNRFQARKALEDFAFAGHGFWYQGIAITSHDNVASGTGREAFVVYPLPLASADYIPLEFLPYPDKATLYANDTKADVGDVDGDGDFTEAVVSVDDIHLYSMIGEIAYGSNIGFMLGEHRVLNDSVINNFIGWNLNMGVSTNYANFVIYNNLSLINDVNQPNGIAAFTHHGTSDVVYNESHIEGFAIGLQVPRAGNNNNSFKNYKIGEINNGYFNNIVDLHFVLNRNHDYLHAKIVNPTFGSITGDALSFGINELTLLDGNGDINVDSSSVSSNGFAEIIDDVNAGLITQKKQYYFASTDYANVVHVLNMALPTITTLDMADGKKYQLFFKAESAADYVLFPSSRFVDGVHYDSTQPENIHASGTNNNLPAATIDATNAEVADLYNNNPDQPLYQELGQNYERGTPSPFNEHYPGWSASHAGSMLPVNYENDSRFEILANSHNMVAMRIDDLPDYQAYLEDITSISTFDFNNVQQPLLDSVSNTTATTDNAAPIAYNDIDNGRSAYFNGIDNDFKFTQPFSLAHKTFSISANVRPLSSNGVIIENVDSNAGYQLALNNGAFEFSFQTESGVISTLSSPANIAEGIWYNVTAVYSYGRNKTYLYVDGNLVDEMSVPYVPVNTAGDVIVGSGTGNFSQTGFFHGLIDDLQIIPTHKNTGSANDLYQAKQQTVIDQSALDMDNDSIIDILDNNAFAQVDTDGDGVDDLNDALPYNAAETQDSDNDGWGDNQDAYPLNPNFHSQSDLLLNGGAENGSTNWGLYGAGTGEIDVTQSYSGAASFKLESDTGSTKRWQSDAIIFNNGERLYTISGWYKSYGSANIYIKVVTTASTTSNSSGLADTNGAWTYFEYTFTHTADIELIDIRLKDNTSAGASWFDDVALEITALVDTDNDGIFDHLDPDDDNDNFLDGEDLAPLDDTINTALDIVKPILSLNGNSNITINIGDSYIDQGASALDDVDGDISQDIIVSGTVDSNSIGSYLLTYNVVDQAQNAAIAITRTVNVVDLIAPVITINGNLLTQVAVNQPYTDLGAVAVDNADGDISNDIVVSGSVDTSTVGDYTLYYNVSDSSGNNAAEVSRTVSVFDNSTILQHPALVGWWTFDEESTLQTIDRSGNSSDAILGGDAQILNGQLFVQGAGWADLPIDFIEPLLDQKITISFWSQGYDNSAALVDSSIVYAEDKNDLLLNIELPRSDESIYWQAGRRKGFDEVSVSVNESDYSTRISHWVFVKDASDKTMSIYLDGALYASVGNKGKTLQGMLSLVLGAQDNTGTNGYHGVMDDVRIYNDALDASTIADLYGYGVDDGDLDNDGVNDDQDLFPADPTRTGIDTDNDGIDNAIDDDDDNDGVLDINDDCPIDNGCFDINNLLYNPSFEAGTNSWTLIDSSGLGVGSAIDNDNASQGQYSAGLVAAEATGTVQYKSDAFALSATTDTITVSGSVLRENVNITHSFISVKVTLVDDSTQTKYVRHNFVDAENVWENHTQVLTYSQQIKAIVFVSLRVKESGGRLHYDDLSVIEN